MGRLGGGATVSAIFSLRPCRCATVRSADSLALHGSLAALVSSSLCAGLAAAARDAPASSDDRRVHFYGSNAHNCPVKAVSALWARSCIASMECWLVRPFGRAHLAASSSSIMLVRLVGKLPPVIASIAGIALYPISLAMRAGTLRAQERRSDIFANNTHVVGVHDAFRLGCNLEAIMVVGRWSSSEMPERYGRRILAS